MLYTKLRCSTKLLTFFTKKSKSNENYSPDEISPDQCPVPALRPGKVADYEVTRATVERTLEYAYLKAGRDRYTRQIEQAGRDLAKLAERYGR